MKYRILIITLSQMFSCSASCFKKSKVYNNLMRASFNQADAGRLRLFEKCIIAM